MATSNAARHVGVTYEEINKVVDDASKWFLHNKKNN